MPRFLVVDDDYATVRALTLLLMGDGHHVVPVTSGSEAVATLARESFDVVLTDLEMPGTDGRAVVCAAVEHGSDACHIILSARGKGKETELVEAGACGVIDKPVDYELVARVVTECRRPGGARSRGECELRSMASGALAPSRRR